MVAGSRNHPNCDPERQAETYERLSSSQRCGKSKCLAECHVPVLSLEIFVLKRTEVAPKQPLSFATRCDSTWAALAPKLADARIGSDNDFSNGRLARSARLLEERCSLRYRRWYFGVLRESSEVKARARCPRRAALRGVSTRDPYGGARWPFFSSSPTEHGLRSHRDWKRPVVYLRSACSYTCLL